MIEINLLGNRKIQKTKEKKAPPVRKSFLYLFFGIILIIVAVWYVVPRLLIRQPEIKPIQPSRTEKVEETPKPDSTQLVTEQKPDTTVVEEPKIEPQPVEEQPVYTYDFSLNSKRIDTFSKILNSIKPDEKIGIVSVTENNFIVEVVLNTRNEANKHTSILKDNLQNAKINSDISNINDRKVSAKSWGNIVDISLKDNKANKTQSVKSLFQNLYTIARKNHLIITESISRRTVSRDNLRLTPIIIKCKGNRNNCIRFLEELNSKNYNIILEKINIADTDLKLVNMFSLEIKLIDASN